MLTQDPWDNTIDQFCALNTEVARTAMDLKFGEDRFESLKINESYPALRLLFQLENLMHAQVIQQVNQARKATLKKNKKNKDPL